MALRSLRNHHGFFSEYWLGTVLGARAAAGARLTGAQARKALDRVSRLVETVNGAAVPDLMRIRERFARPLLADYLGFDLHENTAEPKPSDKGVASESGGLCRRGAWTKT